MNAIVNPFIVSGKIPDRFFCDRQTESEMLLRFVESQENIVLMSQRRMGKTKLVEHCFDRRDFAKNYAVVSVDILHTSSFREFVQVLGTAVFDKLATRSSRMMKLFTSTLLSLQASFGYDPVQNTPTFDIRLGDITRPDYTLGEIISYIEKCDRRCVVVIDEFQQITKYSEKNVEALLRSHIQNMSNATFVFSGSQRRLMEEMFFSEKRPFFMSARTINLKPIERDIYTAFAVDNFKKAGKGIVPEAIGLAYDTFLGVTLYVQRIMKDAFNITPNGAVCDPDTVRRLIDCYVLECDSRMREQLAFVTEAQKELLYAINNETSPVKNITSASFVNAHRMKSPSAVQSAARKLLEYDMITKNEGRYSIADPLLAIWLKSRNI
ncbi:MAG: ATP-binding protein [Prevotella sp.]